ncbi:MULTISPECIES: toprim domain-containing protein [Niastella]|uniref:Toprim domain-containing protein n=1 Tax=Niastella soli TaxID=2821487 RepID=A0ABS3YNR1_9BACT|nr:toprim domain-containing protein [Niastella soli]MBO9199534.1 toprim domain-containing protein [Niastella soli]
MKSLSCEDAKQVDLVEYLAYLDHHPQKVHNENFWYLSPLREEKTASFKVNRQKNVWYDHAVGKGGDLIDFGTLYHNCSVSELLGRLSVYQARPVLSFHPPTISDNLSGANSRFAGEKKEAEGCKIVVLDSRPLAAKELLNYLEKRCIPLEIANRFCKEVDFLLYNKKHTVIGFQNNSGGYELRSENFKGSSSPKDITFVDKRTDDVAVFEGFFSFLSFCTVNKNLTAPLSNCLVLNSLSFFEKSRSLMEQYNQVHLILDRDSAGMNRTKQALQWDRDKYIDRSDFYKHHKDLNDWLIHHQQSQKQSQRQGRRL